MEAARNTAQAFTAPVLPLRSCPELDGKDLRWQAIEHRKSALAKLIRGVPLSMLPQLAGSFDPSCRSHSAM
jgi:hypothetical protein